MCVCVHIYISIQSLIAPLQGFLNAIVYGWTRDDFVRGRQEKYDGRRGDGRRRRTSLVSSVSTDDDTSALIDSHDHRDRSPLGRPRSYSGGAERKTTESVVEVKRQWLTASGSGRGSQRKGNVQDNDTNTSTGVM